MKNKRIYFNIITCFIKKPMIQKFGQEKTRESIKEGKKLYRYMLENTDDIGDKNPMKGNIYMGYVFMVICRAGNFNTQDFKDITVDFMNNKLIKNMMAKKDINDIDNMNKLISTIHKKAKWVDDNPQYKEKTWDFNFDTNIHKDGFYYHFTRCPMEKFARENGYLDVLPICCDIDYLTFKNIKGNLYRDHTVASGGDICDYWIVPDKIKNPR